jgi:wyosine [tRNA(Phe)-imidazoG37] synthetase (radical SAM superfamily)
MMIRETVTYEYYDDYAKFLKTIKNPNGEDFIQGNVYPILGEDKENYYIQSKEQTNQVAQFSKEISNESFIFTDPYGNEI